MTSNDGEPRVLLEQPITHLLPPAALRAQCEIVERTTRNIWHEHLDTGCEVEAEALLVEVVSRASVSPNLDLHDVVHNTINRQNGAGDDDNLLGGVVEHCVVRVVALRYESLGIDPMIREPIRFGYHDALIIQYRTQVRSCLTRNASQRGKERIARHQSPPSSRMSSVISAIKSTT